jgi:hypothetical protein
MWPAPNPPEDGRKPEPPPRSRLRPLADILLAVLIPALAFTVTYCAAFVAPGERERDAERPTPTGPLAPHAPHALE